MKRLKTTTFYAATVLLTGTMLLGLASPANALDISIGTVRVQLPNGQVLTINDGDNWYHDRRVAVYKRYYYEPQRRVYVVYNEDYPPRNWNRYRQHEIRHENNGWHGNRGNDHDYNGNDHDNNGHNDHNNHGRGHH